MKILDLFFTFFKIGAFTLGGGFPMLPIIEREIVTKKKLMSDEEYIDSISLAQTAPGPIAANISILVGYRIYGFWGAIAAFFGAVLPSFMRRASSIKTYLRKIIQSMTFTTFTLVR